MLASNVALWVLWLSACLLTRQVVGHFTLLQTNCKDPDGTRLLNVATIVFLAVGVLVFAVFLCDYYTQWLHKHLRRLFDYNRSGHRWTCLMRPAVMSGLIYATWLAFLTTAYELAAQPNSSLLAATEETATFPAVLSIALCIRPVADVVKVLTKIHKRKCREKKDAARQIAASREPDPPRSVLEAQTSFAPLSEPKPDPIPGNRTAPAPDAHGRRAPSLRDVDERVERRRRRRHESEADSDRSHEVADEERAEQREHSCRRRWGDSGGTRILRILHRLVSCRDARRCSEPEEAMARSSAVWRIQ
ncbi:hypothetical protein JCM1841_004040 [Sporobolomyces salmonicolor]